MDNPITQSTVAQIERLRDEKDRILAEATRVEEDRLRAHRLEAAAADQRYHEARAELDSVSATTLRNLDAMRSELREAQIKVRTTRETAHIIAGKLGIHIDKKHQLSFETVTEHYRLSTAQVREAIGLSRPDEHSLKKRKVALNLLAVATACFYSITVASLTGGVEARPETLPSIEPVKAMLGVLFGGIVATIIGAGMKTMWGKVGEKRLWDDPTFRPAKLTSLLVSGLAILVSGSIEFVALERVVNDTTAVALNQALPSTLIAGLASAVSSFYILLSGFFGYDDTISRLYDSVVETRRGKPVFPETPEIDALELAELRKLMNQIEDVQDYEATLDAELKEAEIKTKELTDETKIKVENAQRKVIELQRNELELGKRSWQVEKRLSEIDVELRRLEEQVAIAREYYSRSEHHMEGGQS